MPSTCSGCATGNLCSLAAFASLSARMAGNEPARSRLADVPALVEQTLARSAEAARGVDVDAPHGLSKITETR